MRGTWQTTGGGGESTLPLIIIGAIVLLGSGAATAIGTAVSVALIIIASTIGLAVAAGTGFLIWRLRQEPPGRLIVARPMVQVPPAAPPPRLGRSQPREISGQRQAPQIVNNFYGYTPDQMAQALARQQRAIEGERP